MIDHKDWVEILNSDVNGFKILRIKKGEFSGIEYAYGSMHIEENKKEETAQIQFEYDILNGDEPIRKEEFKIFIGDILISFLDDGIKNESVIYYGGE